MTEQPAGLVYWGIDNEYTTLRDVLLGRPDYFRWVDAGPMTQRTLRNIDNFGVTFDLQAAQAQHAEMVRCHEDAGGGVHCLSQALRRDPG